MKDSFLFRHVFLYLLLATSWLLASSFLPVLQGIEQRLYAATIGLVVLSISFVLYSLNSVRLQLQHLSKNNQRYQLVLEAAAEAIWEWDIGDGAQKIYFSPSYYQMLGYDKGGFDNTRSGWQLLLHPDEKERVYKRVMSFITNQKSGFYTNTYRMQHSDGSYRWIKSRGQLVFDADGKSLRLVGMATDVTTQRVDQERLQQANAVFENTSEGVVITNQDNIITFVNPAFSKITGYSSEEAVGHNPRIFKSGRHTKEFYNSMWRALEADDFWSGEIWNRRKNGEILPQLQSIKQIRDENGLVSHSVAIFADISLLKRSQSELSFLAHYDPLTNLANRLLLHEQIKLSLRRAIQNDTNSALFIVDLDHFKSVNESLGHSMGDDLLKAVADRLSQFLENNASLSRFGGDEFAVVFDNINHAADAASLAQQILTLFDAPFNINNNDLFITASIGICLFPTSGSTSEEVFRYADTALSKAKTTGRATFAFYTSELTDQAYQRLKTASELRYAIDNGQLIIHYQPVYSLHDKRIIGCEALVRWQHPEQGIISPLEFIPIAEDSGLISGIDSWVLNQSCLQMKNWIDNGLSLNFVAVNISSRLFGRTDFADKITMALETSQLAANYLELEITESAVMDDQQRADDLLNHLCSIGVRLALDDFGTGYSSLNRLKSLPVHKLKIDQSFIKNLPNDDSDLAIVRAIIALGFSMQLEVQAEGIETAGQAEFLLENNCRIAQGYYFGRPLPAEQFESLVSNNNK